MKLKLFLFLAVSIVFCNCCCTYTKNNCFSKDDIDRIVKIEVGPAYTLKDLVNYDSIERVNRYDVMEVLVKRYSLDKSTFYVRYEVFNSVESAATDFDISERDYVYQSDPNNGFSYTCLKEARADPDGGCVSWGYYTSSILIHKNNLLISIEENSKTNNPNALKKIVDEVITQISCISKEAREGQEKGKRRRQP